jgi:ATP:ADP antiporter, AAA family
MVATAFSVAQTRLVGEQVHGSRNQLEWLGTLEANIQGILLVLQLLATSRLLKRLPAALFLSLLPVVAMVGIGALSLWPTVVAVSLVQMARRVSQFAFEKPAREVLYTPFDLETKHKVKFLLDTFIIRLGDFLGACYQVLLVGWGVGVGVVALGTVGLAVVWAVLGLGLGRGSQKRGDPAEAAAVAKPF